MTEVEESSPDTAFVALMSSAAEQAVTDAPEAPYGYTRDRQTGELRPKKSPGRGGRRHPPSIDELKAPNGTAGTGPAAAEGEGGPGTGLTTVPGPPSDRAPDESRKLTRSTRGDTGPAPAQPKQGVIARGVNKLYRQAGKIVRAMDSDIGTAIIEAAKNTAGDGEPDDSVGAAWEELARTNPRVRKFLLKVITGGAWGQLVMAHAPIAMAILMKPAILKLIPFATIIESMAEPDEDTPKGEGGLPGGMTAADVAQVTQLAQAQMERMGMSIPPEVAERMGQMAAGMANGMRPAPATVRNQPRRPPGRASRGK